MLRKSMRSLSLPTVLRGNDIWAAETDGNDLLPKPGRPVENERHRIRCAFRRRHVDQQPLTVARDVGSLRVRRQQEVCRDRRLERRRGLNLDELPLVGELQVDELAAAARPPWASAARRRDLELLTRRRERLNKNLLFAGLVRPIGDPPAVGREACVILLERGREQRSRLPISRQRQEPQI